MSLMKWIGSMANSGGKLGSAPGDLSNTGNERYFGLENFGNTCYCNSVVQALYACKPFRDCVQEYKYPTSPLLIAAASQNIPLPSPAIKTIPSTNSVTSYFRSSESDNKSRRQSSLRPLSIHRSPTSVAPPSISIVDKIDIVAEEPEETLLSALQQLFVQITTQKKKTGSLAPERFISKVKKDNEAFRSTMHQDAHEMLNFTLNSIVEVLQKHRNEFVDKLKPFAVPPVPQQLHLPDRSLVKEDPSKPAIPPSSSASSPSSWVHALFEGLLTNETKCLTCETVTNKVESFLDLSVDIEQHSSLSSCLRNFSNSETLCQKNKFFCDQCSSLQEAEKRMKVKKLPNVLAVHLKRFKYQERLGRYIKLSYRVVFPLELRLFNTSDDAEDADRLYKLFAFIVHVGSGPYHGHYVTVVRSHDTWLLFDDDDVTPIDESDLYKYYGDTSNVGCGYIFFYMADGYDATDLIRMMAPDWTPSQPEQLTPEPSPQEVPENPSPSASVEKIAHAGILGSQTGLAGLGGSVSIPAIVNAKRKISKRPSVTLFGAESTGKGSNDGGGRTGDGASMSSQHPSESSGAALVGTPAKESKEGWGWFSNLGSKKDKDRTKSDEKKSIGSDSRSGR